MTTEELPRSLAITLLTPYLPEITGDDIRYAVENVALILPQTDQSKLIREMEAWAAAVAA